MRKFALLVLMSFCCVWTMVQDTVQSKKLNKMNMVVKEWNTDAKTNRKILDHVTTYNPDGKKIEEIEYGLDGQKARKRYESGSDGRMLRELVYNERNVLDNYKKYEYNEFGKKHTQYTYDSKGKLKSMKVFEYITQDAGD